MFTVFKGAARAAVCICAIAGLAATIQPASPAAAQSGESDFKVTLLGTGIPVPQPGRFGASTLVEVGGQVLVFDVGRGTSIRLFQLHIPLSRPDAVFLTHLHSDHTVGLPDLLMTGWLLPPFGQRRMPMTLIGPTGTEALADGIETAWTADREIRKADEKLPEEGARFDVTEFAKDGTVWEKDGVKVTAFTVNHGELIKPAVGYAIDYKGKRVVISGDTRYDPQVVEMGRGADLLIHCVAAAKPETLAKFPALAALPEHMASPEDVGRVMSEAKPKLGVYSHVGQVPPDPPSIEEIMSRTRAVYDGPLEMGEDLMSFDIGDEITVSNRMPNPKG